MFKPEESLKSSGTPQAGAAVLFDADGNEITVGCKVQLKHPSEDHKFVGTSKVVRVRNMIVEVKPTGHGHIPIHLPENLLVVEAT